MAVRIGFYHLLHWPLERALPKLLERAVGAGHKVVVMAGSAERVRDLDALLWTYEQNSWLPHGSVRDGDAALQPVFLTDRDDNPNLADILVLTDGVTSAALPGFVRCLMLFDGNDEEALAAARARWTEWKAAGYRLEYHQQTERGGWELKAEAGNAG